MREILSLEAKIRETKGTRRVNRLRSKNVIPAVLYGEGKSSVLLEINKKDIQAVVRGDAWENVIIDLKIKGESKASIVIIKEVQIDPLKRNLIHLDLCKISLKDKIKVHVPVEVMGEAPGVKNQGGVLEHLIREIEIECLPTQIPETLKVDVSSLEIGGSITVGEVMVPADVKVITEKERVVVKVIQPTILEEKPAEEVAPLAEKVEPEVISKGKKEETEEEAEEPKKPS
ncbi:MAG: 50S ribosomal protein L25 [bacterium]